MKNINDEIQRITYTLRNLEANPDPSPQMRELIHYYKLKSVYLQRKPSGHFTPIGDLPRYLILDELGDTKGSSV